MAGKSASSLSKSASAGRVRTLSSTAGSGGAVGLKECADFPAMVQGAAAAREPHRITGYLEGLARLAHAWYHKYRVLGEPEEAARLVLARAVQQVLANGLSLLGIRAPERM